MGSGRREGATLAPFFSRALASLREPLGGGAGTVRGELIAVVFLMSALTAAILWPQVRQLGSIPQHQDPLFSMWRLAWVAHQLPRDPLHLYDANIFWPERATLANSDGMPLAGVIAAPLVWLGVPIAAVYNVWLIASFILCGVAMYALVRALVGQAVPAAFSGVAFAFYPFRLEHYPHLELLFAFWMPLAVWALHRTLTTSPSWRTGALLGVTIGAQYLMSMYFGIFLALYLLVVGGVLIVAWRRLRAAALPLLTAAVVAGLLIAPTIPPYLHVRATTGERTLEEVQSFSAQPSDYLAAEQPGKRRNEVNERQVYPGVLIVALAVVALWPPVGALRWALVAGLLLMLELSFGTYGRLQPLLYDWVLPFRALRVPARASMLVGFTLCVLAGFGAARVVAPLREAALRALVTAALCTIVLFETRAVPKLHRVPPVHPVYSWFRDRPHAVVAEMPMWYPIGGRFLLNSTAYWQRMVNGFSGSVPHSYRSLHAAMRRFPDDLSLALLWERGVSSVIVHEEFYGREVYRKVIAEIEQHPSLTLITRASDGRFEASLYALR